MCLIVNPSLKNSSHMMNEHVDSIMVKNPVTLSPDATLQDVREIFAKNKIHHIPITDDGTLVGLITTYDLWKLNKPFDQYGDTKVSEIMSTKIAKISPEDKVGTAAEIFLDNRFHALPVVDENKKLVGIITTFDVLLYEFKKEYKNPILFKEVYEKGIEVQK